eukprot:gene24686-65172_t
MGAAHGARFLVWSVCAVVWNFHTAWAAADSRRKALDGLAATLLDAADEAEAEERDGRQRGTAVSGRLKDAFRQLSSNLSIYSSYLPASLLPDGGAVCGGVPLCARTPQDERT